MLFIRRDPSLFDVGQIGGRYNAIRRAAWFGWVNV